MNVAFPALITFLVLLPGFVFRSRLKLAERTSLDYSPFGHIVTEGVLWAVVAHTLWLTLAYCVLGRSVDATLLLKLLVSEPQGQAAATAAVGRDFGWVSGYFVTLLLAVFATARIARILVTKYRLDRESGRFNAIFRFHQAPWYYLLTGADFEIDKVPDFIVVSSIVNVAGKAYLYTGILEEFFVDAEGKLDRIVLQEVMRRPIASDKTAAEADRQEAASRFYPIDGDYFVLRYSEAITLNVEYVKLIESNGKSELA
jgi:hypothetical protein